MHEEHKGIINVLLARLLIISPLSVCINKLNASTILPRHIMKSTNEIGKFQRIRSSVAVAQFSFNLSPALRAQLLGIGKHMMSMTYTKQIKKK